MNQLFNEQYQILLEELQEITNPYERAHVRAILLGTLAQLEDTTEYVEQRAGKEAIKNDNAKPIEFPQVQQPGDEVNEIVDTKEDKTTTVEDNKELAEPEEIDLDKSAENDPIIVKTEDGEIDVTEACNLIKNFKGSDEEKLEIATDLTVYNLIAIYEGLSNLKDCRNKMMLAYYMSEFGLEEINNFVSQLTDGTFNDIYEFINDENLDGFITNIESAIEDDE